MSLSHWLSRLQQEERRESLSVEFVKRLLRFLSLLRLCFHYSPATTIPMCPFVNSAGALNGDGREVGNAVRPRGYIRLRQRSNVDLIERSRNLSDAD